MMSSDELSSLTRKSKRLFNLNIRRVRKSGLCPGLYLVEFNSPVFPELVDLFGRSPWMYV